jgi:hypothetical protein
LLENISFTEAVQLAISSPDELLEIGWLLQLLLDSVHGRLGVADHLLSHLFLLLSDLVLVVKHRVIEYLFYVFLSNLRWFISW